MSLASYGYSASIVCVRVPVGHSSCGSARYSGMMIGLTLIQTIDLIAVVTISSIAAVVPIARMLPCQR